MDRYELIPRESRWVLRRENAKKPIGRFAFKESAIQAAIDYVKGHGGTLTIKSNEGDVEKRMKFLPAMPKIPRQIGQDGHLLENPFWFDPSPGFQNFAGRKILILSNNGTDRILGILLVELSKEGPLRYSIKVIDHIKKYLSADAIRMLEPVDRQQFGSDFRLTLA